MYMSDVHATCWCYYIRWIKIWPANIIYVLLGHLCDSRIKFRNVNSFYLLTEPVRNIMIVVTTKFLRYVTYNIWYRINIIQVTNTVFYSWLHDIFAGRCRAN